MSSSMLISNVFFVFVISSILFINPLSAVGKIQIKTTNNKQTPSVEDTFKKLQQDSLLDLNVQERANIEMQLGNMYVDGYTSSFQENFKGAYNCYKHAAELGNVEAQFKLLDMYDVYKHLSPAEQGELCVSLKKEELKKACQLIVKNDNLSSFHSEACWRLVKLADTDKEARDFGRQAAHLNHE